MPLNLSKTDREELARHFWKVFTNDSITQQVITEELARRGEASCSQTHIFYAGKKIPVFVLPFDMVLYLANNKHKVPYSFTAYHRKSRSDGWHIWKEGRETPLQKLMKEFPKTAEELRGEALKKKKRDNLMKKPERKPRSRPSPKKSARMP